MDMDDLEFNQKLESSDKKTCQGSVFKADVYEGRTSRGLCLLIRLNRIVKLSCKGCIYCDWEGDSFLEVSNDWKIQGMESVKPGKYYTVTTCDEERDWETGFLDSWNLKLVEYIFGREGL